MDDYISRQAALKKIEFLLMPSVIGKSAKEEIKAIPAADVRPVVRGKWEIVDNMGQEDIRCSVCGEPPYWHPTEYQIRPDYCPNCGADMRGGDAE